MKKKIIISIIMIAAITIAGCGNSQSTEQPTEESTDTTTVELDVEVLQEEIITNDVTNINLDELLQCVDADFDVDFSISGFHYLSSLDEVYTPGTDDSENVEWLETATEEGIYEFEVVATDAENTETLGTWTFTLYLDTTAPEIIAEDLFVVQDDLTAEPEYEISDDAVTDNFDTELNGSDATINIRCTDEEQHIYTVRIKATDTAGNTTREFISITVITPEQAEASGIEVSDDGTASNPGNITIIDKADDDSASTDDTDDNSATTNNTDDSSANTENTDDGSANTENTNDNSANTENTDNTNSDSNSTDSASTDTSDSESYTYDIYLNTALSIPAGYNSEYARRVLDLVNEQRAAYGLSALTWDDTAASAANTRVVEIVSSFSHTRPDGRKCATAYTDAGGTSSYVGENIAAGYMSPEEVVNGWMNSEGHRANILNANYTTLGVGCYYDPNSYYGYYWVQMFVRP